MTDLLNAFFIKKYVRNSLIAGETTEVTVTIFPLKYCICQVSSNYTVHAVLVVPKSQCLLTITFRT